MLTILGLCLEISKKNFLKIKFHFTTKLNRDAEATYVKIFSVKRPDLRGEFMLHFLDNGQGMDPDQCVSNFYLGNSHKRTAKNMELIGRYGNGLKA